MNNQELNQTQKQAFDNYSSAEPWPADDNWHSFTNKILQKKVHKLLEQYCNEQTVILNAGCGKTTYITPANIIYMDIIKDYVEKLPNHIVGSIENIPLEDSSVDCIICVGSVINYTDIQKSISEFSRVLKENGIIILEFERSNSAEFLFTKNYGKTVFKKKYAYNDQVHILWMYREQFTEDLCNFYQLKCVSKYRFHIFSSLLYRLGINESKAAKYCFLDKILQPVSYPLSHNAIFVLKKFTL